MVGKFRHQEEKAQRVVACAPQKSGNHQCQELLKACGYKIVGQTRIEPDEAPVLDTADRDRLADRHLDAEERAEAKATGSYKKVTDELWAEQEWSWYERLGVPVGSRYDLKRADMIKRSGRRASMMASPFSDTPSNVAWMLHELPLISLDGGFVREWAETGEPRMIFNYRDPARHPALVLQLPERWNWSRLRRLCRVQAARADLREPSRPRRKASLRARGSELPFRAQPPRRRLDAASPAGVPGPVRGAGWPARRWLRQRAAGCHRARA